MKIEQALINYFSQLPKLATIHGFVAAYVPITTADYVGYACLYRSGSVWTKAMFNESEVVAFKDSDQTLSAARAAVKQYPSYGVTQLNHPIDQKPLSSQLYVMTGFNYNCDWKDLIHENVRVGFVHKKSQQVVIFHEDDLFRHAQTRVTIFGSDFNIDGVKEDAINDMISNPIYGFAPQSLVDTGLKCVESKDHAKSLANEIKNHYRLKHRLETKFDNINLEQELATDDLPFELEADAHQPTENEMIAVMFNMDETSNYIEII